MMNNDDPVLRDRPRARRRSRSRSIGRRSSPRKFGGRAVLATGLLPPTHWAYNGDVPHWDRDLAARARAARRGRPAADGTGRAALHLVYKTSTDAFRVAIARVIAAQLAEVGIDGRGPLVRVRDVLRRHQEGQLPARVDADRRDHRARLLLHVLPLVVDPDAEQPRRRQPLALPQRRGRSAHRSTGRAASSTSRQAQADLRPRSSGIVADDVPIVPLWHEDNVVLSNVDVEGYTITPERPAGRPASTRREAASDQAIVRAG